MSNGKDVLVYQKEWGKRTFLVGLSLSHRVGALADLASRLEKGKYSVISGFVSTAEPGGYGRCSFYVTAMGGRPTGAELKELVGASPFVKEVEVKTARRGILVDSLNFPLRWNSGDRAILLRTEFFRVMEDGIRQLLSTGADVLLYQMGLNHGNPSWRSILSDWKVADIDDLREVISLYSAVGWGTPEVISFDLARRLSTVKVSDNFEGLYASNEPRSGCNFIRGHLAGLFCAVFGVGEVKVAETKCISKGAGACEFEVRGDLH